MPAVLEHVAEILGGISSFLVHAGDCHVHHAQVPTAFVAQPLGSQNPEHAGHDEVHGSAGTPEQTSRESEIRDLSGGVVRVDLLNNNNSQYYGDFSIGNPKQRFTAIFDTGSGITWIPGAKCTSDVCQEHHRFAPSNSESFAGLPDGQSTASSEKDSIHYGTGEVKFEGGRDTLTFCDSHDNAGCHGANGHSLTVQGHPFGMSTHQTTYPFRVLPFDGILGLAPSASKGSVLAQLKAAKSLSRNVLGVYLSEDSHRSGSIDFGGVELTHIAPKVPLHWHKITNPESWELSIKDVFVDGKPLHICDHRPGGVCPAVVDTGSSLISGPSGEIDKLLSKIRTNDDCSNLASMPHVSLQIQDRDGNMVLYPLKPEEYTMRNLEEVPNTGDVGYFNEFPVLGTGRARSPEITNHCEPGIGVMDVPGKKWVIGDTFLRRYYSIFDDDKGLIGFVRSIHPDEASVPTGGPPSASTASAPWLLGLMASLLQSRFFSNSAPGRAVERPDPMRPGDFL